MVRYCSCGYPIWLEPQWSGQAWAPAYYDRTRPVDHAEPIVRCPCCGDSLRHETLTNELVRWWWSSDIRHNGVG